VNTGNIHERQYWDLVDFRADLAREFHRNDGRLSIEEHVLIRTVERLIRQQDHNSACVSAGLSFATKGRNARRFDRQGLTIEPGPDTPAA
jgi:hypothetical protein